MQKVKHLNPKGFFIFNINFIIYADQIAQLLNSGKKERHLTIMYAGTI